MASLAPADPKPQFTVRWATKEDSREEMIKVILVAFEYLSKTYGNTFEDLSDRSVTEPLVNELKDCTVVALTQDGIIVGVNFLTVLDLEHRGVGPVAVHPDYHGFGIGRKIMELVIEKGAKEGAKSLRLLQDCCNPVSFALYASLGFETKEIVACIKGNPTFNNPIASENLSVRKMVQADIIECSPIMTKICGFARPEELQNILHSSDKEATTTPLVCEEKGKGIVGFTAGLFMDGFTLVPSQDHLQVLLQYVAPECEPNEEIIILVPYIREAKLVKWLLKCGFKVAKLINLMVLGEYRQIADGIYLPSISY